MYTCFFFVIILGVWQHRVLNPGSTELHAQLFDSFPCGLYACRSGRVQGQCQCMRRTVNTFSFFCVRYEHSKPLKQEEAAATDLTTKPSLAAAPSLSSGAGQLVEMNTDEAESRNANLPAVGAGSEDWVNAIEFVPGQPYCGRSEYLQSAARARPGWVAAPGGKRCSLLRTPDAACS